MKLPDLPQEMKAWDRYKAFHWNVGYNVSVPSHWQSRPFIVFDTGEVICNACQPRPEARGNYELLNVRLTATRDSDCPVLETPDGQRVPKAWLNYTGQQYLLIDEDLGLAFSISGSRWLVGDKIPKRFASANQKVKGEYATCSLWYPGAGRMPVAPPIELRVPLTNKQYITDEEREHVQTMHDVCRAEVKLRGIKLQATWGDSCYVPAPLGDLLKAERWDQLSQANQYRLFNYGPGRKSISMPHLVVK